MHSVVLFDLDNTLIDRDRAFQACLQESFADPVVREELSSLDQHGHGDRQALLWAWSVHSRRLFTQADLGAAIAAQLRPDPRLLEWLAGLAARIGIVTNGGSATQRAKIRAAGLDQVFAPDHIWISAEVGASKPDPEIFWRACRHLNAAPHECLFVGDHPSDEAGALAAGLAFQRAVTPL